MGKKASSGNTPPRINLRGMYQLLSATEAPKIENRRLIGILMGTVAIIGAQALALAGLTPLKERIPYAVEVETATGAVAASGKPLAQWKPEEANLRYFLGRWTENLLAIDEHSRDMRLPGAYGMLRGDTAFRQFEKLVREDERHLAVLREKPRYRRQAKLISISFIAEKTVLIRVELTDNERKKRRVQVTANFALIPPDSDEQVLRNPVGLWIINFGVQDELV